MEKKYKCRKNKGIQKYRETDKKPFQVKSCFSNKIYVLQLACIFNGEASGQCYKAFFVRKLRIFAKS
jgi:hypothetical protein